MRGSLYCAFCCMLLVLSASASGQDTNFSTGPQYLMHGSPLFARPISTPLMSLAGPPLDAGASNATEGLAAGAGNQTAVPQPQPDVNLFPVYYAETSASDLKISFFAEPFPDLLTQPSSNQLPQASSSGLPEPSANRLPAGILDAGVGQITTSQALRERGYGITLVEAANYGKVQTRHATRVYTNADIDRLHGGS
jgi:hypothetical protein